MVAALAAKGGQPLSAVEMAAIVREESGRETPDQVAAVAELSNSRRVVAYAEMRNVLAERFGWSYSQVDEMDFGRIREAWLHVCGKTARNHDLDDDDSDEVRQWRWREWLKEHKGTRLL